MGVVGRSIEGVDDPPAIGAPRPGKALLGQEAVRRKGGRQAADKDLLGPQVERGDQVDGPLEGHLDPPAKVFPQVQAGLADNGLADPRKLLADVHRVSSYQLPQPKANLELIPWPSVV